MRKNNFLIAVCWFCTQMLSITNNFNAINNYKHKLNSNVVFNEESGYSNFEELKSKYTLLQITDDAFRNYRIITYEVSNSSFYNGKDEYLGFSIEQNPNVDINIKVSHVVLNGGSVTASGGYEVDTKYGLKILGNGVSAGVSEDFTIGSIWETTSSMDFQYTLSLKHDMPSGVYYMYKIGYTADYVVTTYLNNELINCKYLKSVDGMVARVGLLQKTPTLLKPLSIKC